MVHGVADCLFHSALTAPALGAVLVYQFKPVMSTLSKLTAKTNSLHMEILSAG